MRVLSMFGLMLLFALGCGWEVCNNLVDDDGDSQVDSMDGDCRSEDCTDGIDNDDDGDKDCNDDDCQFEDACGFGDETGGSTSGGCCKYCGSTSQPCGDTCISNSSTCHTSGGCACE